MKVIFCVPGNTFTEGFVRSWTSTIGHFLKQKLEFVVAWGYSSSVFHCRNDILFTGNEAIPSRASKPFGGRDYDYAMWIDSDTVWNPEDVTKLLETGKDIVTGLVPINPGGMLACGQINGFNPTMFLNAAAIEQVPTDDSGLIPIEFAGCAFLAVRRGVFESMTYPWFWPSHDLPETPDGRLILPSEDFGWCMRATSLGWKIYAHPQVKLGHQKTVTLGP